VGYRVNSYQATQFRIWATRTLSEFMVKGFVLDDERLKQGKTAFGKDYFEDLLERIREIRTCMPGNAAEPLNQRHAVDSIHLVPTCVYCDASKRSAAFILSCPQGPGQSAAGATMPAHDEAHDSGGLVDSADGVRGGGGS
jgi:Virulence protein RhuM family